MHTVDAVDLREGVGEGIDEGHAAFLGEIITGGVIDLDHDLAVPGAEVLGRNVACSYSFLLFVDIELFNGGVSVRNLDNSGRVEGLTVRSFSDGQHGLLLLETLIGQQKGRARRCCRQGISCNAVTIKGEWRNDSRKL